MKTPQDKDVETAQTENYCPRCWLRRVFYDGWNCPTEECESKNQREARDFSLDVFILDWEGERYSGSNFADIESARACIQLQPNRDALQVGVAVKFILANSQDRLPQ